MPLLFSLVACANKPTPPVVWVDVARLAPQVAPLRLVVALPKPPGGMSGMTASLPARPTERLVAEAGIDGAALAREVDEAQADSLKQLRRKLSEVYRREGDRFARAQIRALGDPYRKATQALYPDYRKKFESYAAARAYPAAVLAFAVGAKDPNALNLPVDLTKLDAYGKLLAKRASEARTKIKALDAAFGVVERDWVASIQSQGDSAKAATYAAIEANRDALNRQALMEATLDLGPRGAAGFKNGAIELRLARRGVAQAPAVPARTVTLPAIAASPTAPRVESPKALANAQARLLGEARIWAAQGGYVLSPRGRDATSEFERWRNRRAGASPNSPISSAGP